MKYNIEEQLASKLGNRSIEPSAGSWERVAFCRQQKKTRRKPSRWIGIAVIFTVTMALTYWLLREETTAAPSRPVVTVVEAEKPAAKNEPPAAAEENIINVSKPSTNITARPSAAPIANQEAYAITPAPLPAPVTGTMAVQDRLVLQKSEEIAAELQRRIQDNQPVTDAVVDSLLRKAQREIALERLEDTAGKADANALLKEAESEVNRSFRESTLNLFKTKFRTIRIALH